MKIVEVQNELRRLQYKDLQAMAKTKAIRANRKKEDLVEAITERMNNQEVEDFLKKTKREKEVVPAVKSLLLKREWRNLCSPTYDYEARRSTTPRDRRYVYNPYTFPISNSHWRIDQQRRSSPERSKSPLYSQFVNSDYLPCLEENDLTEIEDDYVPNGTVIDNPSWSNQVNNHENNNCHINSSQLRNNNWNSGIPPQKYGTYRWHTNVNNKDHEEEIHRSYLPQVQFQQYSPQVQCEQYNPQVQHQQYNPQVQSQQYNHQVLSTSYGYPQQEYNSYRSVRYNEGRPCPNFGPRKRVLKPKKSSDQIQQWSDVMTSPSDPLIGSYSVPTSIKYPVLIEQKTELNVDDIFNTNYLEAFRLSLDNYY